MVTSFFILYISTYSLGVTESVLKGCSMSGYSVLLVEYVDYLRTLW